MMRKAAFGAVAASRRGHPGQSLYNAWVALIDGAGGTYTANSKAIALDLADQVAAATYAGKIRYLLPFLGADIISARAPLIDRATKGLAVNHNFVNGDFGETTGLQGNGSSKYLETSYTLADLAGSALTSGGFGYWETNVPATAGYMMGARDANLFMIYLDPVTPRELFYWGNAGNAQTGVAPGNNDYYNQVSDAAGCAGYRDATQIVSTASNQTAGSNTFCVLAVDGSFLGAGRCGAAYLTDGSLTGAEISAWHSLLATYLMAPTGR